MLFWRERCPNGSDKVKFVGHRTERPNLGITLFDFPRFDILDCSDDRLFTLQSEIHHPKAIEVCVLL
jgi:hypothetical protein